MNRLQVNIHHKEYTIFIGSKLIEDITSVFSIGQYSKIFVITDENVAPIYLEKLISRFAAEQIILPAGENNKTIESIEKIWNAMHKTSINRSSLVINLGGGVICDMGGFAAATYMRGVDFLNIPTTLLSQVDASVGGKTGIDFANVKNLVGTFNQPMAVIIDVETLKTLPKREFVSGFAEVYKHGLIHDSNYFDKVTRKLPGEFDSSELEEIIAYSCQIKSGIVSSDETEQGSRKILNFGHTIGHAIEALSLDTSGELLHGEAISIGMVAEAKLATLLKMLSEEDLKKIENALVKAELPVKTKEISMDKIMEKIKSDKKNKKGQVNFTLINKIGKGICDQYPTDDLIEASIKYISE